MCWGAYWGNWWFFVGGAGLIAGGCLFSSFDSTPRTPSRRSQCRHHLIMITIALQNYHDQKGCLPPPFIADAEGKPMHSWRVLLLPYLERQDLYARYNFDEPWDGPSNRKLHNEIISLFRCPSCDAQQSKAETNYVAVVGPQTLWPENRKQAVRLRDVTDGLSNTLMVVEVANSGIHWMEPRDLHIVQMPMAINPPRGQGICSGHHEGANVAFADGSVRFMLDNTPPNALRATLTISGGESVTLPLASSLPLRDSAPPQ
jgi:prepilin-type processing-associated H-X9-DG protein